MIELILVGHACGTMLDYRKASSIEARLSYLAALIEGLLDITSQKRSLAAFADN